MIFEEFNDQLKKTGEVLVSSSNGIFDEYKFVKTGGCIDVYRNNKLDEQYGDVYNAYWDYSFMLKMISTKKHHASKPRLLYGRGV